MSELLKPGQVVISASGVPCTIVRFLGGGGQGEVYKAEWAGRDMAVKWYFDSSATSEQHAIIKDLVARGSPSDKFLWPLDLLSAAQGRGFGYVMPLRPDNFKSLTDLMAGKIAPSFHALVMACYEMTKAFRSLHSAGLCYRDISFGNAYFDPANGDVLICDNDNVGVNRAAAAGVLGTPDFMAPEIVRGEEHPSTNSDLHSLAVLLFYMLFVSHPLQGEQILKIKAWDRPARELLFGKKPVFIFDPVDNSNAAVDFGRDESGEAGGNALVYWDLYPGFLRQTFVKAFTTGLRDPHARVTEREWQDTLARLRNSIFRCRCGTPNFFDAKRALQTGQPGHCWNKRCGTAWKTPFQLKLGKEAIMLNADTKLHAHHLDNDWNMTRAVAEVVRHPTDPDLWGLKNLTTGRWVVTLPDGAVKDVDNGRSVPLRSGVHVNFGKVEGEIVF